VEDAHDVLLGEACNTLGQRMLDATVVFVDMFAITGGAR
jgi:hypothetical protein